MSEIRIAIPDLDLNNALRLDGNLRNYEIGPFDDVVLDFSRMTNFDPLPMLMAGAIIKRFRYGKASLNPSEMAETQFYKDELLKCFSKENRKTKLFVYAKDTEGAEHKRKAGTVGKLIDNLSK